MSACDIASQNNVTEIRLGIGDELKIEYSLKGLDGDDYRKGAPSEACYVIEQKVTLTFKHFAPDANSLIRISDPVYVGYTEEDELYAIGINYKWTGEVTLLGWLDWCCQQGQFYRDEQYGNGLPLNQAEREEKSQWPEPKAY